MKQLLETIFFSVMEDSLLLKHDSSIMENAYDEFVHTIFETRCNVSDVNAFYNSLCYVQVELKSLQRQSVKGEKKYPNASFRKSDFAC